MTPRNEELWRVTDPLGHEVILTTSRWEHILNRRAWFFRYFNDLRLACRKPEVITAEDNDVYYYRPVGKGRRRQYILAVVEEGTPRRLMTAYLVDRFRKGEVVIWPE